MINIKYIVKKGDTLYGISNQFGVSVQELINENKLNNNNIIEGMELIIPSTSGTNPDNMLMYTVKSGDTLYSIAKKYNTTVKDIIELNNLSNYNIKPGNVLKIPEKYNEEMQMPIYYDYIVKKGDTLYSIARNNNISVDTLKKDNSLSTNNLQVGQILKIRKIDSIETGEECYGNSYIPAEEQTYIVKKGDNLYSIARKFNTTVASIKTKNKLNNNLISIGQKLII